MKTMKTRSLGTIAGALALVVSILGSQAGVGRVQAATFHSTAAAHGGVRPHVAQNGSGSPFVTFNVFSTPGVDNALGGGIAAGPDGRMWITDLFGGTVDAITTNGAVTQFAAPGGAQGIAAGPRSQGRVLWFTRQNPPSLNRITTAGTITTFPLPAPAGRPVSVVAGPDGAMWFTTWNPATIGRISAHGHITQFPLAGGQTPESLTVGPDGNLWFVDFFANKIGRITPRGAITLFSGATGGLRSIAAWRGALYVADARKGQIVRVTTDGQFTYFPDPSGVPVALNVGPDGNLWTITGNVIGNPMGLQSITPSMTFSTPVTLPRGAAGGLATGPDGNLWLPSMPPGVTVYALHALTAAPTTIALTMRQTQTLTATVSSPAPAGGLVARSSDTDVATVTPTAGNPSMWTVTAVGVGSCVIRVSDGMKNTVDIPVSVTP